MKIRKLITLLAVLLACFPISARAVKFDTADMDGNVTISGVQVNGKDNIYINLFVIPKGTQIKDIMKGNGTIIYQGDVISGENGIYKKTFKLSDNTPAGEYDLYAGDGYIIEKSEKSLIYSSIDDKAKMLIEMIDSNSGSELSELIEKYKDKLGYDLYEPFNVCDGGKSETLISGLKSYLDKSWIEILNGSDNASKKEIIMSVHDKIRELSVISCYNLGKCEGIFNSDGTFNYDDVTGFKNMDVDGVTIYSAYTNYVNNQGKNAVKSYLINNNISSADQLRELFAKAVIVEGIKNPKTSGTGYISEIITNKNADISKMDFSSYLSSSKKSNINAEIIKIKSLLSFDNIEEKVNEITKLAEREVKTGGNSGSTSKRAEYLVPSGINTSNESNESNANEKEFDDIYTVKWANTAIKELAKKDIVNGMGNNKFEPLQNIMREQAVKIICLVSGQTPENSPSGFEDVEYEAWYSPYITTAYKKSLVNGISDSIFGIGTYITRQDFSVMLYRALGEPETDNVADFFDKNEISYYAVQAINYLSATGVINGYDDGSFRAKEYITRAEAAKMVYEIFFAKESAEL